MNFAEYCFTWRSYQFDISKHYLRSPRPSYAFHLLPSPSHCGLGLGVKYWMTWYGYPLNTYLLEKMTYLVFHKISCRGWFFWNIVQEVFFLKNIQLWWSSTRGRWWTQWWWSTWSGSHCLQSSLVQPDISFLFKLEYSNLKKYMNFAILKVDLELRKTKRVKPS